jgi:hypothetical protein
MSKMQVSFVNEAPDLGANWYPNQGELPKNLFVVCFLTTVYYQVPKQIFSSKNQNFSLHFVECQKKRKQHFFG